MGGCYYQIYFLTIYHVTVHNRYLKLTFKDVLSLKRKSHWQLSSWSEQIVNNQERVKRKHKLLGCTEINLMYGFVEFQEKAWSLKEISHIGHLHSKQVVNKQRRRRRETTGGVCYDQLVRPRAHTCHIRRRRRGGLTVQTRMFHLVFGSHQTSFM